MLNGALVSRSSAPYCEPREQSPVFEAWQWTIQ
jgi:hypothetical protein